MSVNNLCVSGPEWGSAGQARGPYQTFYDPLGGLDWDFHMDPGQLLWLLLLSYLPKSATRCTVFMIHFSPRVGLTHAGIQGS